MSDITNVWDRMDSDMSGTLSKKEFARAIKHTHGNTVVTQVKTHSTKHRKPKDWLKL